MKGKKELIMRLLSSILALNLIVGSLPLSVSAVEGDQIAADGTYASSERVIDEYEFEWPEYEVEVSLEVESGVFKNLTVSTNEEYDAEENSWYLDRAYTNATRGFKSLLEGMPATVETVEAWDVKTGATCTANAIKTAALEALAAAPEAELSEPDITLDTSSLSELILIAETKNEADYTTESWSVFKTALESAKTAIDEAETQEVIDSAEDALNFAMEGLEDTEAEEREDYVYGTINLPYADYYYGELNDLAEVTEMDLDISDKVTGAGYRESGMYDAVSSATSSKYKNFPMTYYEDNEAGTGGEILGVADVTIAVPEALYNEAREAIEAGSSCNNQLLTFVESMSVIDVSEGLPSEYKVLNGDGTLRAMVTKTYIDTSATSSITTNSRYGNYQLELTSDYLPTTSNMLGAVIETSDGEKYGMGHLENLWTRTGQISFAVEAGFYESHGNLVDYQRHESLQGKTITKVIYLIKDSADLIIETNLQVKYLLGEEHTITAENGVYAANVKVEIEKNFRLILIIS
ncbi:MAG: hypothetical protein ACK5LL_03105 [Suipraeoptans sp.]